MGRVIGGQIGEDLLNNKLFLLDPIVKPHSICDRFSSKHLVVDNPFIVVVHQKLETVEKNGWGEKNRKQGMYKRLEFLHENPTIDLRGVPDGNKNFAE
jgi:hypothetical protein